MPVENIVDRVAHLKVDPLVFGNHFLGNKSTTLLILFHFETV